MSLTADAPRFDTTSTQVNDLPCWTRPSLGETATARSIGLISVATDAVAFIGLPSQSNEASNLLSILPRVVLPTVIFSGAEVLPGSMAGSFQVLGALGAGLVATSNAALSSIAVTCGCAI